MCITEFPHSFSLLIGLLFIKHVDILLELRTFVLDIHNPDPLISKSTVDTLNWRSKKEERRKKRKDKLKTEKERNQETKNERKQNPQTKNQKNKSERIKLKKERKKERKKWKLEKIFIDECKTKSREIKFIFEY